MTTPRTAVNNVLASVTDIGTPIGRSQLQDALDLLAAASFAAEAVVDANELSLTGTQTDLTALEDTVTSLGSTVIELAAILTTVGDDVDTLQTDVADHETRIDALEAGSAGYDLSATDHFITASETTERVGAFGWAVTTANGGTVTAQGTFAGHLGVVALTVTNAAGSLAQLSLGIITGLGASGYELGAGGAIFVEAYVRLSSIGSLLSIMTFGLADSSNPNRGLFVELRPATDGNWALRSIEAGGGDEQREAGAAAAASTWTRVGLTLNAAGTSAQLYVNGVASGDPITTDLPNESDALGLVIGLTGAAGASGVVLYVDAVTVSQDFA